MSLPVRDGLLQIFDVEHGACALFTSANVGVGCKRMLIDCGHNVTTQWTPGNHLQQLGVRTLEQLVITNYDEDHVSGYPDLLQRGISVQWLMRNGSVAPHVIRNLKSEDGMGRGIDALVNSLAAFTLFPAATIQPPQFPGVQLESFCNPYPAFDDENNLSMVLYARIHDTSFMFPGDMECAGFEYMLAHNPHFRSAVSSVDVLIASHHGRENGICQSMFDDWNCRPRLVVISDDYKQFDTQETVSYYSGKCLGIEGFRKPGVRKVLTTRRDSEIVFSFHDGRCTVL
jgi:beta-lactamase superfamily II metal-dependent hydrolase